MNITIVAFDIWGFNKLIVDQLKNKGHEVTFINSHDIKYVYKNKNERIKNFFLKTFLKKNIKKDFLNKELIDRAKNLSPQDCILVVNPFYFRNILGILKTKTTNLIAYNYDSLEKVPLPNNYETLFSRTFSFDTIDVKKNTHLSFLPNYIYLDKDINKTPKNKVFMILSDSIEREEILNKIAFLLDKKAIKNFEFIVLKPSLKKHHPNTKIISKGIGLNEVIAQMKNSEILIDLIRDNQTGLSFRIFEAMALHKKLITNNQTIKDYDFYNPNNILIIDQDTISIPDTFLNSEYEPLNEQIYQKYTLENWIKTVFNI